MFGSLTNLFSASSSSGGIRLPEQTSPKAQRLVEVANQFLEQVPPMMQPLVKGLLPQWSGVLSDDQVDHLLTVVKQYVDYIEHGPLPFTDVTDDGDHSA